MVPERGNRDNEQMKDGAWGALRLGSGDGHFTRYLRSLKLSSYIIRRGPKLVAILNSPGVIHPHGTPTEIHHSQILHRTLQIPKLTIQLMNYPTELRHQLILVRFALLYMSQFSWEERTNKQNMTDTTK